MLRRKYNPIEAYRYRLWKWLMLRTDPPNHYNGKRLRKYLSFCYPSIKKWTTPLVNTTNPTEVAECKTN